MMRKFSDVVRGIYRMRVEMIEPSTHSKCYIVNMLLLRSEDFVVERYIEVLQVQYDLLYTVQR